MNSQTRTLLLILGIFIFICCLFMFQNNTVKNNGNVEIQLENEPEYIESIPEMESYDTQSYASGDYCPESDWISSKFNSRNKAKCGEYKESSYSGSLRGNMNEDGWIKHFDHNNSVIKDSQMGYNDKFLPVDESGGTFAVFKSTGRNTCGSNQDCEPEELYNLQNYLPQEVNDDWYEVVPEPVSVKNRDLINITRPIGVNTIQTHSRNSSYDIRGAPACPKTVVGPFLQSSIEPDTNLRPLM